MATLNQDLLRALSASLPPASHVSDWDSLWAEEKFIPWDRGNANPAFIDFLSAPSNPPTSPDANPTPGAPKPNTFEHTEKVQLPSPLKEDGTRQKALVPGCGKGYDVALLASWGYDAYGLEISKHAVDKANAYLENSGESALEGGISMQCLLGDYFDDAWVREAGGVEGFTIIYDHTFLCAIQPTLRPRWAARTASLLSPTGILVCLEFPAHKSASSGSPPWSLPPTVHLELFKRPGEDLTYDHNGVVVATDRNDSADALVRIAHWTPKRTHEVAMTEGVVRVCVSVWRHKKTA
ncbi:S-adenosyl-L-methionine-dependent methyltransferase [Corynespora cassiicola Philippines]|uniref:S-adenosyl-L-methionine-dependent methyltransferase n=1 Tax=Corynespora cassiicola Philippines TaxID=1448308 RepID=A0A2T2NQ37_CORCC|nr:S-adenosyl-L-methionine-dependent methyltransferase [Corynespora cassiicola Philippines]